MKKDRNSYDMLYGTKGDILNSLKSKLVKSKIEDLLIISSKNFMENQNTILNIIKQKFYPKNIIVRSSSKFEDSFKESNAGHFKSIIDVKTTNLNEVKNAIMNVIHSYGDIDNEQILIQSQTNNVLSSGVVFTRDIKMNKPYYIINYDESGSTTSVTSGLNCNTITISHYINKKKIPKKWKKLIEAIKEIESIFYDIPLDIEFAITNNSVVIFQVRPIASIYKNHLHNKQLLEEHEYKKVKLKYKKLYYQKLSCFSDMAFWNPVEMIGDNPFPLDYSLYENLITKSSWNKGIVALGYHKVPNKLMYQFGNKPFISLERSFESLIPASVSDHLFKKLLNYYIKEIKKDLSCHDKIEFEISHNCYDFSLEKRLQSLIKKGFSEKDTIELKQALLSLTNNIINNYNEILKTDLQSLEKLEQIREKSYIKLENCLDLKMISKQIGILIEAIKNLGVIQFSRQARCAFIAKSICNSLLKENYISTDEYNLFLSSINTITVEFNNDYSNVMNKKYSLEKFNDKYGHLRTETYNIRCNRYDRILNKVITNDIIKKQPLQKDSNESDKHIIHAFERALEEAKINEVKAYDMVYFIKKSIEEREYFKFIFTKSVSYVLELIKKIGNILNMNNNDLSFLTISDILQIKNLNNIQKTLTKKIELNKIKFNKNGELILPEVICSENDFDYFESINSRPNFVTENIVSGKVILLNGDIEKTNVNNKIVVIERADPGYDWIFTKNIIGLVTKYGGVSSHLSIRCHEFNIPAAIGCGSKLFEMVSNANNITIDCKNKKII